MIGRTARGGLAVGLARLTHARRRFDKVVQDNIEEITWEEAALILREAKREVALLQSTVANIEAVIVRARRAAGEFGDVEIPGVGVVRLHRTTNRKAWDHLAVAAHVVEEHLAQREGEMPTPWEVRDWLMDAAGISYWRTGVLRGLGLDADDFCEAIPGRYTIEIIGGPAHDE